MARRKIKSEGDDGEKAPPYLCLPVGDELRNLAAELLKVYVKLPSQRNSSSTGGLEIQRKIVPRKSFLVLTVFEEEQDTAIRNLSELGRCKNDNFPSTPSDYYERCQLRVAIKDIKAKPNRYNSGSCTDSVRVALRMAKSDLLWEDAFAREIALVRFQSHQSADTLDKLTVGELAQILAPFYSVVTTQDVLTRKYGSDPLEDLASLLDDSNEKSEVLIFLEQYLLFDLSTDLRNLAETGLHEYRIKVPTLTLLTEFECCFRSFSIVRSNLLPPDHKHSTLVDEAHHKLLRLASIVRDTASPPQLHKIILRTSDEDLIFIIDGAIANLAPKQQATLVALAILQKLSKFSAAEFSKLVGLSANDEQNVINRCLSLQKKWLPYLAYTFKNGICTLRGIRFDELPTEKRLREEF